MTPRGTARNAADAGGPSVDRAGARVVPVTWSCDLGEAARRLSNRTDGGFVEAPDAKFDRYFEKTILPRLISTYEAGRLVPFIGLGMSRRACSDWPSFIGGLESAAGVVARPADILD